MKLEEDDNPLIEVKIKIFIDTAKNLFKAYVRYFLSNFYFSSNDSPLKTEKCFLFHLKSFFRSQDIQIFVFPSSPLFPPVNHCLEVNQR